MNSEIRTAKLYFGRRMEIRHGRYVQENGKLGKEVMFYRLDGNLISETDLIAQYKRETRKDSK